jgi:hypothetical protein
MNAALQTPVALFLFNRPDVTRQVFRAIAQARPTTLFLVADGPRDEQEAELCAQARAVAAEVDWDCEVHTDFAEANMGCGRRLASGISWVFSQVEEAIILEDDCLPHPTFFGFCRAMLERWRHDERVMMVSGDNFLDHAPDTPASYLFSRYFPIWGWATWRRAWDLYDREMRAWPRLRDQRQLEQMYPHAGVREHLRSMFDAVHQGRVDTWDVQWFHTCLFNNGLCIVPRRNLVSNIGIQGTHSSAQAVNHGLPVHALDLDTLVHPETVHPDALHDRAFFDDYFPTARKPGGLRGLQGLTGALGRLLRR